jgi:hypothetical protein
MEVNIYGAIDGTTDLEAQRRRRRRCPRRYYHPRTSSLFSEFDDCTCTDGEIPLIASAIAFFIITFLFVYWNTYGV